MSQITRTYSFSDNTTAYGSQVEIEIANITTAWNNHDSASSSWTAMGITGNLTVGGSATFTGNAITSGIFRSGNGNATTPAFSFSAATTYGMWYNGSGQLTIQANGTLGAYLNLISNGDILNSQIAPLATNATAGFSLHLPTVGGTPTGTPTSYTGQKAMLYDTAANKIWVYNGGWRSVAVS